jgi:hypothetical protein
MPFDAGGRACFGLALGNLVARHNRLHRQDQGHNLNQMA